MLSDEQRLKIYGSAERVAEVDAQIEANVAAMPPLTMRQRDALAVLLSGRTRCKQTTTAAPVLTETAA